MKRLLTICILALCCVKIIEAQDALCHRLSNATERSIGQSYQSNSVIAFDSSVLINGMTISGHLTLQNRHSFARVILVDIAGNEYLLYEGQYWGDDALIQDFDNMALETIYMEHTTPAYLKIAVNHATLRIDKINYSVVMPTRQQEDSEILLPQRKERLNTYSTWKSQKWQEYNTDKSIPWIAMPTSVSKLTYSEKKKYYGLTGDNFNLYGMEYYAGGYFVIPDTAQAEFVPRNRDSATSPFVDHFDWRHRHGKNWMTIPKNQREPWDTIHGNGGCWAFAAISSTESRLNLYYNQLLNLDLSEQELGSCAPGSLHIGGDSFDALTYIRDYGITTEDCFPFENNDTVPCEKKCNNPNQIISISGVCHIEEPIEFDKNNMDDEYNLEDSLKYELINHGPLASGIDNAYLKHVMCLCGYHTVCAGDSIHSIIYNHAPIERIVENNSPYIGLTCWIYKNSNGPNGDYNGYLYAVFEDVNSSYMKYHNAPVYPIRTSALSDSDIAVTDEDNDGYYFWGLGPKPSHCPVCCPDTPDGDDSDPTKAVMDSYGIFSAYQFPYPDIVKSNSFFNLQQDSVICGNLYLNQTTMLVNANLIMNPAAKIVVNSGSLLLLNQNTTKATIIVKSGGKLQIQNGAVLKLLNKGCLQVELGGELVMSADSNVIIEQ